MSPSGPSVKQRKQPQYIVILIFGIRPQKRNSHLNHRAIHRFPVKGTLGCWSMQGPGGSSEAGFHLRKWAVLLPCRVLWIGVEGLGGGCDSEGVSLAWPCKSCLDEDLLLLKAPCQGHSLNLGGLSCLKSVVGKASSEASMSTNACSRLASHQTQQTQFLLLLPWLYVVRLLRLVQAGNAGFSDTLQLHEGHMLTAVWGRTTPSLFLNCADGSSCTHMPCI